MRLSPRIYIYLYVQKLMVLILPRNKSVDAPAAPTLNWVSERAGRDDGPSGIETIRDDR